MYHWSVTISVSDPPPPPPWLINSKKDTFKKQKHFILCKEETNTILSPISKAWQRKTRTENN